MPTVNVTDVVVRTRKVRMSAACPNCGGTLEALPPQFSKTNLDRPRKRESPLVFSGPPRFTSRMTSRCPPPACP